MRHVMKLAVVILLVAAPAGVSAQSQAAIWKAFAEQVDAGAELTVRLQNGQRFRATLIAVRDEALLLQPKTRVPVPVQSVPYEEIATLERRSSGGIGAGQAAAIGVATGAGAFLAILLILAAALD
jgi:hypothetical protein